MAVGVDKTTQFSDFNFYSPPPILLASFLFLHTTVCWISFFLSFFFFFFFFYQTNIESIKTSYTNQNCGWSTYVQSGVNIGTNGFFHIYSNPSPPPSTLQARPSSTPRGSSCFLKRARNKSSTRQLLTEWRKWWGKCLRRCAELEKMKLSLLPSSLSLCVWRFSVFLDQEEFFSSPRILNWAPSLKRKIGFFLSDPLPISIISPGWQPLDPKEAASCLLPPSVRDEPILLCSPRISLDAFSPNVT